MKRTEQQQHNRVVVKRVIRLVSATLKYSWHLPSYAYVVNALNAEGLTTSRGNAWTPHGLFRMLQRYKISGLWKLKEWCLLTLGERRKIGLPL
jgi:hypothetical protein